MVDNSLENRRQREPVNKADTRNTAPHTNEDEGRIITTPDQSDGAPLASLGRPLLLLLGGGLALFALPSLEGLNAAITALDQAREETIEARDALLAAQAQSAEERTATLKAIWQRLADVSHPMNDSGALIVSAIHSVGQQIDAMPGAPTQIEWLTGISLGAMREGQYRELREHADTLLQWLEPYLEGVSPHTRSAVVNTITRSANGNVSTAFAEHLNQKPLCRSFSGPLAGSLARSKALASVGYGNYARLCKF